MCKVRIGTSILFADRERPVPWAYRKVWGLATQPFFCALNVQFRREPRYVGFMPHWESLTSGNWEKVCNLAGIRLIDPRVHVERVIADILGCEVLVTEAMHGAIVADALRVPWIPVLPINDMHRLKWFDWAESLCLPLTQHRLWPSSLSEASTATIRKPLLSSITAGLSWQAVSGLTEAFVTYAAAQRLSVLAKRPYCLSDDAIIANVTEQMIEQLNQLQQRYRK